MLKSEAEAESSFAGLTAQVQVFGRVGMAAAAAISDLKWNGFLKRLTTKKEMKEGKAHGLFHGLPEELKITALMCAMEMAPATHDNDNRELDRQREAKKAKEELIKAEGLEKASNQYIECLVYHKLWDSDRCWKTAAEVRKGVKDLRFKKDKEQALKDNIQIRFKGFGWDDARTTWSKDGKKKSIAVLQSRLIEIITKTKKWNVPDKPPSRVPQRNELPVVGTLTRKVRMLDEAANATADQMDIDCRAYG